LIVAFGTRRERYDNAFQMQCYSGIAPVKEASGKSEWIHFRWACPKFLRQTFHEYASHSLPKSEWARPTTDSNASTENRIMLRCELWPTNGSVSFSGVGRPAHPTMSRPTYSPCKKETRPWPPPVPQPSCGNRSVVSKNFLKIPLDGLTQKTPPLWLTQPEISTSRLMPASSPRCVPVAVQMPQNGKAGTQILAVAVAPSTLSVTGVMTDVPN
jgi:hypothetical protein